MLVALWIIAIVEIIRMLQNFIHLMIFAVQVKENAEMNKETYKHFREAMRGETAKIFAKKMLDEFDERHRKESEE